MGLWGSAGTGPQRPNLTRPAREVSRACVEHATGTMESAIVSHAVALRSIGSPRARMSPAFTRLSVVQRIRKGHCRSMLSHFALLGLGHSCAEHPCVSGSAWHYRRSLDFTNSASPFPWFPQGTTRQTCRAVKARQLRPLPLRRTCASISSPSCRPTTSLWAAAFPPRTPRSASGSRTTAPRVSASRCRPMPPLPLGVRTRRRRL